MRRTLAAALGVALLAGCPTTWLIRPDAFGKERRAALVLIQSESTVKASAQPRYGRLKELDAAPIVAAVGPMIVESLGRSPHFLLMPEAKVLTHPAYVTAPISWGSSFFATPPGYRFITGSEAVKVARAVGAEIAIGVGLILVYDPGDGAASALVSIGAVDVARGSIWRSGASGNPRDRSDVRTAPQRQVIEIYRDATRDALSQLEDELAAEIAKAGRTNRSSR